MEFIERIKSLAKNNIKTIVLPESTDIRVLKATEEICKEGFCKVVLVGDEQNSISIANKNNIDISKIQVINPKKSENTNNYANILYELRKEKGLTLEEAKKLVLDPVYFGIMMVKVGDGDGLVSGAIHSTADTLRPALQIIKTSKDTKVVSTASFIIVPECEYGEDGVFVFADIALNQNPNSEELAQIAISSAKTFKSLMEKEPSVAMLSYSTYGSASSVEIDKVKEAVRLAREKEPNLVIDGELQLDAAIVPSIGELKAPQSNVAGKANVLVFPDLQSGNIGYKIAERIGRAKAYGPICQGMAKPVNDLSRGCSSDDIIRSCSNNSCAGTNIKRKEKWNKTIILLNQISVKIKSVIKM